MQNIKTNKWRVEKSLKNLKETAATITTWLVNGAQEIKETYCNFFIYIKEKQVIEITTRKDILLG